MLSIKSFFALISALWFGATVFHFPFAISARCADPEKESVRGRKTDLQFGSFMVG
jgi:hypothetical protein